MNINKWFEDDICWCADSNECTNDDCFRHMLNRTQRQGIFTMGHLKNTELCPLANEKGDME